jgi:hypothetical protein
MPPQALQLAFFLIEEGIKLEPAIAAELRALLNKNDPTAEDWAALRSRVQSKTYLDYVPASALAAGTEPPSPQLPAAAPKPTPAPAKSPPTPAPAEPAPAPAAVQVFTGQATDPHL